MPARRLPGPARGGAAAAEVEVVERVADEAAPEQQEWDDVDAAQVGDEAKKFMEGLVEAFGLEGTTSVRRDGDDLEVVVEGADLGLLVGPRGTTLQAVQELARVAAQRRLGDHDTRLRVDVAGYRVRRREALTRFATQIADEVVSTGEARALEPMSSADRKVIHDALSDHEGVETRSEGDDPARRVRHRTRELTFARADRIASRWTIWSASWVRSNAAAASAAGPSRRPWCTRTPSSTRSPRRWVAWSTSDRVADCPVW